MSKNRDKNIEKFADMFKALSNPNRLEIFMRLVSCCQPGTVTSINSSTGMPGCACVGELDEVEAIEPLRNVKFSNESMLKSRFQRISEYPPLWGEIKNWIDLHFFLDIPRRPV